MRKRSSERRLDDRSGPVRDERDSDRASELAELRAVISSLEARLEALSAPALPSAPRGDAWPSRLPSSQRGALGVAGQGPRRRCQGHRQGHVLRPTAASGRPPDNYWIITGGSTYSDRLTEVVSGADTALVRFRLRRTERHLRRERRRRREGPIRLELPGSER